MAEVLFYLLQISQEKEKGVRERERHVEILPGSSVMWTSCHVLPLKTEENVTRTLYGDDQPSQECEQAKEGNRTDPY